MSQPSTPSKRERRDAARAERLERERAATAAASRKKRLSILGGLLAAAVVIVAVAIVISSSGGGGSKPKNASSGSGVADAAATQSLFAGLPQQGVTVGRADAPVTIVEFADPQCPFCKDFALQQLPKVVTDYVRTGKAKMELRYLAFIGPDSTKAANVLEAAGLQNKLWDASDLLYRNQGEENSGYVTDAFLKGILTGVGADDAKALSAAGSSAVTEQLGASKTLASRYGVSATPTILVGPTGGDLQKVGGQAPTAAAIGRLVDQALKAKGSSGT